jgi:hypothetical protein
MRTGRAASVVGTILIGALHLAEPSFAASVDGGAAAFVKADPAGAAARGGGAGPPDAAWPVAPVAAQSADIWLEAEPNYFRRGDRLNVRVSIPRDSYIAVVHIDSDGMLDFLYPASPWDDGFIRGGRTQSIGVRSSLSATTVWGQPGIGYLYLIASPVPLDFRYFRAGIGSRWDWGYAGRNVYGDPFLAFEQVTRLILPGWPRIDYAWDYHGYHVEGVHRYPRYACSDRYYSYGWGWSPSYSSCSRLDLFVRSYPDYYDTRRYRGDRRVIYRQYEQLDPRYGFKEPPDGPLWGSTSRLPAPAVRDTRDTGAATGDVPRRNPVTSPTAPGGAAPPPPPPSSRPSVPTREPVGEPSSAPQRTSVPTRGAATSPTGSRGTAPTTPPSSRAPVARPAPAPAQGQPATSERPSQPASGERSRPVPNTADPTAGSSTSSGSTGDAPARGRPSL